MFLVPLQYQANVKKKRNGAKQDKPVHLSKYERTHGGSLHFRISTKKGAAKAAFRQPDLFRLNEGSPTANVCILEMFHTGNKQSFAVCERMNMQLSLSRKLHSGQILISMQNPDFISGLCVNSNFRVPVQRREQFGPKLRKRLQCKKKIKRMSSLHTHTPESSLEYIYSECTSRNPR